MADERKPLTAEDVKAMQDEDIARRRAKIGREPRKIIHGNITLEQADRDAKDRARTHPTHGHTDELDVGWASTGRKPSRPKR